ncbi:MAG: hypothetical protein PF450_01905, partial [Bacteroidales bacterium]|nr:hypothetical protein [Bacteroidales bacterium]
RTHRTTPNGGKKFIRTFGQAITVPDSIRGYDFNKYFRGALQMSETKIQRFKAFIGRLPLGLKTETKTLLVREYIVNKQDYSYAVIEAIEQGRQEEKAKKGVTL